MTGRLALIASLLLGACLAFADGSAPSAVTSLKVNLNAVEQLGIVKPVNGITAAGQPNAEQLEVFADNGYVAVIDLRTEGEDRGLDAPAVVEGLGMTYINLPVGGDDITLEKARELREIMDKFDEPVLLHCGSSNRVGALLALQMFDKTGDKDLALEMGRAGGLTRLEGKVNEALESAE
jgi:uncharacterized protein (TIGR01244 family)